LKLLTLNNLKLNPDERGAIIGQTGTGKSVLAKELLALNPNGRLAIIDPKGMFNYGDEKIEITSNPRRIIGGKLERFIFRPTADNLADIDGYNEVYKYCYKKGNFLVYTDDVLGIMSRNKYPHYLQVCYQMGRAKKISMLSAFQRPAWLPLFLCSEASKFYLFRLTVGDDIKRVKQFVPDYETGRLRDKHTFLYYDIYESQKSKPVKVNLGKEV
jgi:energy-coupling factor transporter ATP-binding protein EcfA2